MSVNINHPEDDISTSSSAPPTLGGQSPLVADNATVAADSSGNVSRWVMSTAAGSTGVEDGANTWAKLATFKLPSTNQTLTATYLLNTSFITAEGVMKFNVQIRNDTGIYNLYTSIQVISNTNGGAVLNYDSLKLVSATDSTNVDIELWMKKSTQYCKFSLHELSLNDDVGTATITYNNNAAWQSATPSGAVTITSDWAGSGQLTSTSFSNGWAGTAYYEKLANGQVIFHIAAGTIGTTTDGTTIFTLPSGYRPGYSHFIGLIGNDTTYAASAGRLVINTDGTVQVYTYTGTNTSVRANDVFVARN